MLFKKRLLNNALFAALQTLTSAVLLFFLYRFLLKQLGAEQLGIWAIVLASTAIGRLTDMGLAGAVVKFVANSLAAGDKEKAARFVQTAAISITLVLAALALMALPALQLLLQWVLPQKAIPIAKEILPYAITSLLFAMVSGIFQSGIDACQRMDIRNILLMLCNLAYIAATVVLVPDYGLKGVAIAQTGQSILLMTSCWIVLRHLLPTLPIIPFRWHKAEFKEMLGYATNFQIGLLAGLFFDPVTKFFLAKYGDLSQTAYFEMASQLIQKARSIIISAQQALVPEIAGSKVEDHQTLVSLYKKTYGLSFVLVLPYYCMLAISLPLISILWIGHYEPFFVNYGVLLVVGWFAANLSAVSYFYNIGTGALIWNTVDHVLTGFLNIALAAVLGHYYGGIGVVVAAMISLLIPNLMLIFVVNKRLGLSSGDAVPRLHLRYLLLITIGVTIAFIVGMSLKNSAGNLISSVIPGIIFSLVAVLALLLDPTGSQLISRFHRRPKRK